MTNEYYRERRIKKKEQGLCTYCNNNALPGKTMCKYHAEYKKQERLSLVKMGICPVCKKERIYGDEKRCGECAEKHNAQQRQRYRNDIDNYKARKKANVKARTKRYEEQGLCTKCGRNKVDKTKRWCESCRAKEREKCKRLLFKKECSYPNCFACQLPDCTRSDFNTADEKDTFNIRQRYERG